eukprot:10097414-Ditylum_brightwellii.AAC.1
MAEDVTIASAMGCTTDEYRSTINQGKGSTHHKRGTDPARARTCVPEVARPSLMSLCPIETRTYMQLTMRKLLQLLATRKRRISITFRINQSCLMHYALVEL